MAFPKNVVLMTFLFIGVLALVLALVISGDGYSRILLGAEQKDLSWGPTLFRILLFFHGGLLIAVGLGWKKLSGKDKPIRHAGIKHPAGANWRILIFLSGLTIVALALRVINLNSDLWVDEVITLLNFARLPMGQILASFPSQNQHMLYSLLARASFVLFGESAWALRLPSVIFGVGSIWALFFFCKRILGTREAILASVLMTVSYHHIWFSQNARGYMGLLFFTLLASWFWFEALEKNRWHWWIAYTAAVVLGMWIHMTMAFVVAAFGVAHLVLLIKPDLSGDADKSVSPERAAGLKPFAAWFLSVTITLQLYAFALPEFLRTALHEESRNSEWTNPIWAITESLNSLSIGFAGLAIVIVVGAIAAFGWLKLFRKNRRAAVLMVLPAAFAGAFMFLAGHNLFPRFFFFSMGFGILIAINGALELPGFFAPFAAKVTGKHIITANAGIALVLLMIGASLITVPRNYLMPKQDFSGAKLFVEKNMLPGEEVVAVSIAGRMYGNYFAPNWAVAETGPELKEKSRQNRRLWLVYTLSPEIKAFHPEMWKMIQEKFEVVRTFPGSLNGGEIVICRQKNPEPSTIW